MQRTVPLLLCAMFLAGCASSAGPGAHAGESYMVNSQRTLFYSFGPAQASGPDFALYHGQRLTMLSYGYGYSHVVVQGTGQTGYIPTEDVALAPPLPSQPPAGLVAMSASRHRRRSGGESGEDFRPPTPEEESRIPLPEFPESKPPPGAPSFRY